MNKIRVTVGRKVFIVINAIFLCILTIATLYPFLFVLVASLSGNGYVMRGEVSIIPKGLTIDAYKAVFEYPMFFRSYRNTLVYTVVGTSVNVVLTVAGGYCLSRRHFYGRGPVTFLIACTMWLNAGIIPTFLTVKSYGLYDSWLALILPGAVWTYNLLIMRTFFSQIPDEMEESAKIDGASELQTMIRIFLPLSIPSVVTIMLFYAVGHWNNYLNALIYLNTEDKFPLQMILRKIVLQNQLTDVASYSEAMNTLSETLKYATIIVACLPIICLYPFLQRFFIKGVMIGAIKG